MSRPKPPIDPRELLAQTLRTISMDLDYIEEAGKTRKLDSDEASCLVRYNDALLKHVKTDEEDEATERKKLAKMSTAELAAKADELAKAAREKSAKTS